MKIDLDKSDLIAMVMGKDPGYKLLEHELVKKSGYFIGGFVDKWTWEKLKLNKLTEKELSDLYNVLKLRGF